MNSERTSTLMCPICGGQTARVMPTDACVVVAACVHCGEIMRPKPGDCCVFCSYGNVPCPPIQMEQTSTAAGQEARARAKLDAAGFAVQRTDDGLYLITQRASGRQLDRTRSLRILLMWADNLQPYPPPKE